MKNLGWILFAVVVVGGIGVYLFSKENVARPEIAPKGLKATVTLNNNYQKG